MSVCVVVGERMAEMLASNSGQRQMAAEEKTMKVLVIGATGRVGSVSGPTLRDSADGLDRLQARALGRWPRGCYLDANAKK